MSQSPASLGGLLALLACAGCQPRAEVRPGGNFLVILLDDVGIDQVGAYGAHPNPPSTPVIDQLAADGIRFENAWATPVCTPSRAEVLTGRSALRTGIGDVIQVRAPKKQRLRHREQTLPDLLVDDADYQSAAVGKWHLVAPRRNGARRHPIRSGFQSFFGSMGPLSAAPGLKQPGYSNWQRIEGGRMSVSTDYEPIEMTHAAIEAMEAMEPPWVLYVAFNLAHTPLHAPPPELVHTPLGPAPTDLELYRGMVEAADTLVGELLAGIPESDVADTTVFFAADNGTPSHGVAPPGLVDDGKNTLHEGGLRVPFIVRSPLIADPGGSRSALVSLMDILPTAAEIAGVESKRELDGISLLPLFTDPEAPGHPTLFNMGFSDSLLPGDVHDRARFAIRDQAYKLTDHGHGREHLFRVDPSGLGEEGPIPSGQRSAADAAAAERLSAELARIRADGGTSTDPS